MGGRESIVSRLLSDPRLLCVRDPDSYGFTPLMYAAMAGRSTDVIRSLIADGYEGDMQTPASCLASYGICRSVDEVWRGGLIARTSDL